MAAAASSSFIRYRSVPGPMNAMSVARSVFEVMVATPSALATWTVPVFLALTAATACCADDTRLLWIMAMPTSLAAPRYLAVPRSFTS